MSSTKPVSNGVYTVCQHLFSQIKYTHLCETYTRLIFVIITFHPYSTHTYTYSYTYSTTIASATIAFHITKRCWYYYPTYQGRQRFASVASTFTTCSTSITNTSTTTLVQRYIHHTTTPRDDSSRMSRARYVFNLCTVSALCLRNVHTTVFI